MVPVVDSTVNDGASSPIKGIRKFRLSAFLSRLAILPSRVNKFARENIFHAKLSCVTIVIRIKVVKKQLLPEIRQIKHMKNTDHFIPVRGDQCPRFIQVRFKQSVHNCFAFAVALHVDLSVELFNILPLVEFIGIHKLDKI